MDALFVERIMQHELDDGRRCAADDLSEEAMQRAQVTVSRGVVVAIVLLH